MYIKIGTRARARDESIVIFIIIGIKNSGAFLCSSPWV
jgi:hypothetical protein